MVGVLMIVSIQQVVIIVTVLLDILFNLMGMTVKKVNIAVFKIATY